MNKVVNMKMTVASSLSELREVNSSFDTGILRICYTGANRNGSAISRKTIENCIQTIYNCPIVCHYDRDTDSIGGHDMEVVCGDDGVLRMVNLTQPVGVIPESAKVWFENFEEEDGSTHEYLYAEALLWKRQEAYRKIKSDGITAHSMELTVKDGESINGVYHIKDFEFTAFALIGVDPCFEGSALEMYSNNDFKVQYAQMMREIKESYTQVSTAENAVDDNIENLTEGGKVLEQKMELAANYGIDVSNLDFSIEDMTIEELTAKFEEMKAADEVAEPEVEPCESDVEAVPENDEPVEQPVETCEGDEPEASDDAGHDFALISNVVEEINRCLDEVTVEREYGVCRRYHYMDCDLSKNEVYVLDSEDWKIYGFVFVVNGDAVTIDFASKKRMKCAIVEFDDGDQESAIEQVFELFDRKIVDNAEWEAKYHTASATITEMQVELDGLREFKMNIENNEAEAARNELFAQFSDLEGVDAFETLKTNCSDYDIEALEEKCYAIRGRVGTVAKFALQETATPKLKIEQSVQPADEPYGGLFYRYGFNRKN